jgi:hypothetical protein
MRNSCCYVVALPELVETLELEKASGEFHAIDPRQLRSAPFVSRLEELERAAHAPGGRELPRWALYDCAMVPGAVVGMAERSDSGEQGAASLAPQSALLALPQLKSGHWWFYDLADAGLASAGLLEKTLRAALAALRPTQVTAIAEWNSQELRAHVAVASLDLLATWLPGHDIPASVVFRHRQGKPDGTERSLDPSRKEQLQELQRDIEAGLRVSIGEIHAGSGLLTLIAEEPA